MMTDVRLQKGWSSERVPLPVSSSRRHISAAALMPFNSGKALPSKWEDAERWITSPVSGRGGISKASLYQTQRRPKSKSGPLGPPGNVYYSNDSPAMKVLEGGSVRNLMVPGSPFSTGVMGSESSLLSSQDEKLDDTKDTEAMISRAVSRRDMATQMSPEGCTHSSPEGWSSSPLFPPSLLTIMEPHSDHSAKLEVRDVQADKWGRVLRWSKRYGARINKKDSPDVEILYKTAMAAQGSYWDGAETAKKLQREEAKITAWENLQKAKAERAIRKLEMELEKKRSSTVEKILNKLRKAQMKAQEMRSSLSERQPHQVPKTWERMCRWGSLRACFT